MEKSFSVVDSTSASLWFNSSTLPDTISRLKVQTKVPSPISSNKDSPLSNKKKKFWYMDAYINYLIFFYYNLSNISLVLKFYFPDIFFDPAFPPFVQNLTVTKTIKIRFTVFFPGWSAGASNQQN